MLFVSLGEMLLPEGRGHDISLVPEDGAFNRRDVEHNQSTGMYCVGRKNTELDG